MSTKKGISIFIFLQAKDYVQRLQQQEAEPREPIEQNTYPSNEERRETWDCESVLSTQSNVYNHPQKLDPLPPRRWLLLSLSLHSPSETADDATMGREPYQTFWPRSCCFESKCCCLLRNVRRGLAYVYACTFSLLISNTASFQGSRQNLHLGLTCNTKRS